MSEPVQPSSPTSEPATPGPLPPALASSGALLDAGNWRGARKEATRVSTESTSADDVTAAHAFLERLRPDPWALRFGLVALAALALVAFIYLR